MTTSSGVTTDSVDYLQRCVPLVPEPGGARTAGVPEVRRLLRVRGVGRPDKRLPSEQLRAPGEAWRPRTAELITGLYGYRMPVAFSMLGAADGVRVQLGTWSSRTPSAVTQDRRRDVLRAVLDGLYAAVRVEDAATSSLQPWRWPLSGVALGIPDPAGIWEADGSAPLDRVVASLAGTLWAVLVLAHPVAEAAVARVRQQVLNELRAVATAAEAEGAPSPLAEQYLQLLKVSLSALGEGMATGAWRTGVYLLGDEQSYPRLAAAWRSMFSGVRSLPEPVRVFDLPAAAALAEAWALPDQPGAAGPGHYRRPFELQTLLTTAQLAAYVHLPELETPGFAVETVARFDTVTDAVPATEALAVGRIMHRRRPTASDYRVPLSSLTRHVFVAGVTGSGKTNTLFHLLAQVQRLGVPFLVLEPAKTEYRVLLDHEEIGPRLRVFTLGDERIAPIRLNPFEVPEGTTVSEHLDLLRAAFGASFGMWTPLPQILETCLHAVYVDRGWDLRTNRNRRVASPGPAPAAAFPTLSQLVAKVEEVVPSLGYEDRVVADLRAALVTRLDSLRHGGKGAMLDVERSTPPADLFGQPCVLELEAVGDDDDKAFLMAMVLIRLAEHRRAAGPTDRVVHLLVVEEAHRLLSARPTRAAEEMADPRGQAVDTFINLLAEVRAYGQGMAIIDQVPTRLAPEVLKNTALKIAHRVVAADDRAALGATMAMDAEQGNALVILGPGQAAVFSEGADAPVLAAVPLVKAPGTLPDAAVAQRMASLHSGLVDGPAQCPAGCAGDLRACEVAQALTAQRPVQRVLSRVVLSAVAHRDALDRLWPELVATVTPRRPGDVDFGAVMASVCRHGARWHAERRGSQAGWDYGTTARFCGVLQQALLERARAGRATAATAELMELARQLHRQDVAPYPDCARICQNEEGEGSLCLFRWPAAELVATGRFREAWRSAEAQDTGRDDGHRQALWNLCQDAAYELVEFPETELAPDLAPAVTDSARRASLCFGQQMLDETGSLPRTSRRVMARLLQEAGL